MRYSRVWAIFALMTVCFTVGCGGGGSGSTTSVSGPWSGTSTEKGVSGTTSTLQAFLLQNGTTMTGSVVFSGGGGMSTGSVTGTIQGHQLNLTVAVPVYDTTALRTDQQFGYGAPTSYYTTAPMDLSKPIVVSVNGVVLPPTQYTVDTRVSTLYSNAIYIPTAVPLTQYVQIQYYPYPPSPSVGSTTNFTGTVYGSRITGSYTTSTTSGTQTGTFVLTKETVGVPANSAAAAIGGGSAGK